GLRALAPLGLAALGIAVLLIGRPPWRDATAPERTRIADVLALTGPDESVMDLKGEAVFRRRPVPWVLESVTQERFRRGLMPDEIAAELRATRTAVAMPDHHKLPPGIRAFLNANYVEVGAVRVLGRRLHDVAAGAAASPGDSMTRPLAFRRDDRVLLIAPHPDDETLAAGGLLQRVLAAGARLRVLFVTDGENNPWAQRATERRWRIGARDRER